MLVPDVGEDVLDDGEPGPDAHRGHDTTLGEQVDQPDGLEEDRLSARVRTRNHDGSLVGLQVQIERDHLHSLLDQEGMPATHDRKPLIPFLQQLRGSAVPCARHASTGMECVEIHERFEGTGQLVASAPEPTGGLAKNSLNLGGLLTLQLVELVPKLHCERRFDEESGAGGRLPVDDPPDLPLPLPANGDDVAPLPDGNRGILHAESLGERGQQGVEATHDPPPRRPNPAAHGPEFGAGAIPEFAPLVHDAVEARLQVHTLGQKRAEGTEMRKYGVQPRFGFGRLSLRLCERDCQEARGRQKVTDSAQLHRIEDSPLDAESGQPPPSIREGRRAP